MKDALRFGLKSFIAGLLGCLGVIVMGTLASAVFLFAFKSQIMNLQADFSQSLQSIPDKLSEAGGEPGNEVAGADGETPKQPSGNGPGLFIYLTEGEDPKAQKVNSFPKAQARNVSIWVQSPSETPVNFRLEMTIPDGTRYPFGEEYQMDPSGNPILCGKLDAPDPPTGKFLLRASPEGSETPTGAMEFMITK